MKCHLHKAARVINFCIMADALEESFTLEDLEISQIEELATLPNVDNITTCTCRGHCLRERGRNFCPCKSLNKFCSSACHGDDFGEACMNSRRVNESDSDSSEDTTVRMNSYSVCTV